MDGIEFSTKKYSHNVAQTYFSDIFSLLLPTSLLHHHPKIHPPLPHPIQHAANLPVHPSHSVPLPRQCYSLEWIDSHEKIVYWLLVSCFLDFDLYHTHAGSASEHTLLKCWYPVVSYLLSIFRYSSPRQVAKTADNVRLHTKKQ